MALVPMALAFIQVAWTVLLLVALAAIVIPLFRRLKALEYLALAAGALACLSLVILLAMEL